jgi:hypothetical protein
MVGVAALVKIEVEMEIVATDLITTTAFRARSWNRMPDVPSGAVVVTIEVAIRIVALRSLDSLVSLSLSEKETLMSSLISLDCNQTLAMVSVCTNLLTLRINARTLAISSHKEASSAVSAQMARAGLTRPSLTGKWPLPIRIQLLGDLAKSSWPVARNGKTVETTAMMRMMTTMMVAAEVVMTEEVIPRETTITRGEAMTVINQTMAGVGIMRTGSAPASSGRDLSSVSIAIISVYE